MLRQDWFCYCTTHVPTERARLTLQLLVVQWSSAEENATKDHCEESRGREK